ncbi:hypothetical protein L1887_02900 [Cichorium endivia]|nr:hypothetical protein L1887_02900 [Cichorium endivia]
MSQQLKPPSKRSQSRKPNESPSAFTVKPFKPSSLSVERLHRLEHKSDQSIIKLSKAKSVEPKYVTHDDLHNALSFVLKKAMNEDAKKTTAMKEHVVMQDLKTQHGKEYKDIIDKLTYYKSATMVIPKVNSKIVRDTATIMEMAVETIDALLRFIWKVGDFLDKIVLDLREQKFTDEVSPLTIKEKEGKEEQKSEY